MNISLADKHEALAEYLTKWDAFSFICQQQKFDFLTNFRLQASRSGVFGFAEIWDSSIHFMTLKSVPRGIPEKAWKVSLPSDFQLFNFAIFPQADALAMICWGEM